jgi:hypothetical protein
MTMTTYKFNSKSFYAIAFSWLFILSGGAIAATPVLNFSDLISGPSTGLGDGKGSGVIVTVWGQHLGSAQRSSNITFTDSEGIERDVAYVYYWKNADGKLPGGPANLYESHGMQEVAFSLPNAAEGEGVIKVTVGGNVSTLPFTVRAGTIYHIKPTGNDSSGDGSFSKPWLTVGKADATAGPGSTLYIHDVLTGSETSERSIYNNKSLTDPTLQFGYLPYPNTTASVWGGMTISGYNGSSPPYGMVVSKFKVYASESDEDENGQPINSRAYGTFGIEGTTNGRAVGNYITDTHPLDTNGGCPDGQQAAIKANKKFVENFKILGNHIHEYGCEGTNYQHHTTYLSIRDTNEPQLIAPEMGWNYLQDNWAKNGLHYFDEDLSKNNQCGQFTTVLKVHNNVVINQAGAGIYNGVRCRFNTTFEYTNNILINVGLKSSWDGIDGQGKYSDNYAVGFSPGEAQTSHFIFKNNTIYRWNTDNDRGHVDSCIGFSSSADNISIDWNDNICWQDQDRKFIRSNYLGSQLQDNLVGGNNVWYTSVENPKLAKTPSWDTLPITSNPSLVNNGSKIFVDPDSPIIGKGTTTLERGIYGNVRTSHSVVGAVSQIGIPKAPPLPPSGFSGIMVE